MFIKLNRLRRAVACRGLAVFLTGLIIFGLLPVDMVRAEETEGPKLVMLVGSESYIPALVEAYKNYLTKDINFNSKYLVLQV